MKVRFSLFKTVFQLTLAPKLTLALNAILLPLERRLTNQIIGLVRWQ